MTPDLEFYLSSEEFKTDLANEIEEYIFNNKGTVNQLLGEHLCDEYDLTLLWADNTIIEDAMRWMEEYLEEVVTPTIIENWRIENEGR